MNTLKIGSTGNDVKTLQRKLNLIADGIFGPLTDEAVRAFQASNGLVPDGIVGKLTWNKLGVAKNARTITEIIVHCTATIEGKDYSVDQIRDWHVKGNGWADIGYHYVIYRDGSVHKGRKDEVIGAHCPGHNTISIGVCYVGGLAADGKTAKDTRTDAQKAALNKLLVQLKSQYPGVKIYGHRDFAAKDCPSFDATNEFKTL